MSPIILRMAPFSSNQLPFLKKRCFITWEGRLGQTFVAVSSLYNVSATQAGFILLVQFLVNKQLFHQSSFYLSNVLCVFLCEKCPERKYWGKVLDHCLIIGSFKYAMSTFLSLLNPFLNPPAIFQSSIICLNLPLLIFNSIFPSVASLPPLSVCPIHFLCRFLDVLPELFLLQSLLALGDDQFHPGISPVDQLSRDRKS